MKPRKSERTWSTLHLAIVGAAVLALTSCTNDATIATVQYDEDNPYTWTFEQLIEEALINAEAGNASPEQIADLHEAAEVGEVPASVAREANERVRDCVIDAGITATELTSYNAQGIESFTFAMTNPPGMSGEQGGLLYDACDEREWKYLLNVYFMQPTSRDAIYDEIELHDAELRACLTEMGGIGIDELSNAELWAAIKDQSFGGAEAGYSQEKDCLMSVGIYW